MKKVTRTIETHVISSAKVDMVGGEVKLTDLEPIAITNEGINAEKAIKLVVKKYGKKNQYVITKIETTSKTYALDFEKFMELAEVVGADETETSEPASETKTAEPAETK